MKGLVSIFCFSALIFSCRDIETKVFHEEKFDTNRLVKVQLAADLDEPMETAITEDGRILIIERKGAVKMYLPDQQKVKQISTIQVHTGHEDGLLGVALDPAYQKNNHVFLFYSPTGAKPVQRVSRFVLQKDSLLLSSEKILLEIPTQREECCHSAGSLAFGPQGNLFIAVGDNTNPHNPGYYNSIDERKGREYWDAQRTSANTNDFRGKILRIHPEPDGTYTIPEGNLFPKGMEGTKPEIYVMGCRNPYRIAVDSKKGWLYWGDVGQNTIDDPKRGPISYDEWNLATEAGFFGWPYFAGPNSPYADFDFKTEKIGPFFNPMKPENISVNNTGIKDLPSAKKALIWYSYDQSKIFPYLGTGGKSPIGGPVFYKDLYKNRISDTSKHLHEHFNGKVFIAEWMRDWINVLTVDENGRLDSVEPFMKGSKFSHPIDIEFGPDGVLYVLEYGTYWFSKNKDAGLFRIEYQRGNRAPVVQLKADKVAGSVPLKVQFSSEGSADPDSSALSYQWYFDQAEVQSTDANPSHTFTRPGKYTVKLIISDSEGRQQEKSLQLTAGNEPPEIILTVENGNSSFYWENVPVNYTIEVMDKEDGSLLKGGMAKKDVKVTLAYSTMGTDMTLVEQSHETLTAAEPDFAPIKNSDCKACHAMNDKSIGPSYIAIAERYKKDSAIMKNLASKIIAGGSGAWGEYSMSAHPNLSQKEAIEMVSYILSLKDEAGLIRSMPPSGRIVPQRQSSANRNGEYILSVSYKDKEQQGVGSNAIRKNFHFRNSKVSALTSHAEKGVVKSAESGAVFNESGAWLRFNQLDLTDIRSLDFEVDTLRGNGKLSVRIDRPDGQEIGMAALSQKSKTGLQKLNMQLQQTQGMHDIYIIYSLPEQEKESTFSALFLRSIKFNR